MKDLIMPSVFLGMLIAATVAFAAISGTMSEGAGNTLGEAAVTPAVLAL